ncbi:MAG: class I SAM-dependent methyltransferase [bacterium]
MTRASLLHEGAGLAALARHLLEAYEVRDRQLVPRDRRMKGLCERTVGMGTENTAYLVNTAVSMLGRGVYLEIGSYQGRSLLAAASGNARLCLGVDNFSKFDPDGRNEAALRANIAGCANVAFYKSDYLRFFAEPPPALVEQGIGFYFYDGDHAAEHQREGLEQARPYLLPGALILVDDVNLNRAAHPTLDWADRCGYRVLLHLRTPGRAHQSWGNGILLLTSADIDENLALALQGRLSLLTARTDPRLRFRYQLGRLVRVDEEDPARWEPAAAA